ncbi:manganese-dependent inorganic pyrophosphatase [Palleronia sp.]|uniref:manganese-dependent inorganic pyrophosphatase n=1 Tax=Palleronia sp. TaxID=1940284 RepID=UPI0035C84D52
MTTLVLGHKSPDTDATGSPIIWSWYLNEVKGRTAEPALQGEPNTEANWMLDRWEVQKPQIIDGLDAGQEVVIVDTNNPAELPESIKDASICQIIDHHRLVGGLTTKGPIEINIQPLACTATIMFDMMGDDAGRMPDTIKGVMLSCILSDTLEFRSPTTTDHDRDLAERLASELGIQIPGYAAEMFAAKSDVSKFSDDELLRMDSKEHEIEGRKFRVSVLETTSPDTVLKRKDGLKEATGRVASEDGVDHVLFFIVDILEQQATMILQNDEVRQIAEKSFSTVCGDGDTVVLPGIVSRKKQIIPNIAV